MALGTLVPRMWCLPQPSILDSLWSRGPGSAWVGAARGRRAGGSAGGSPHPWVHLHKSLGCGGGRTDQLASPSAPRASPCALSSRSGRAINKPRPPVATLSAQCQCLVAAWCGYAGPAAVGGGAWHHLLSSKFELTANFSPAIRGCVPLLCPRAAPRTLEG